MTEPRPLAEVLEAFRRDGFVNAGPVLEQSELRNLRQEIDRLVSAAFGDSAPEGTLPWMSRNLSTVPGDTVHQFVNLWEVSAPFARLIAQPAIVELAVALGETSTLQVWYDQAQCKPPLTGGAAEWHQDAPYWGPIEPAIALTAWVALDDADLSNGCMWMVPGSHRWGDRSAALALERERRSGEDFGELPPITPPPGQGSWRGARPCPVRAGEVHFHHCLTWHGSPVNRSDRPRRAVGVHYMPSGVRFTGQSQHPLGTRVRVAPGALMLGDSERFPVVYRDGRPVSNPCEGA